MSATVATEFGAFPQRVLMGVEPENDDEKNQIAKFEAGIDRLLTLFHEGSKIGEFSAVDIANYIEFAEFWDTTVSRVSRVPIHYLKATGATASGETFRMMEQPFTSKIEDRQRSFGYVYADAVRYGLRLQGLDVKPGEIEVKWAPAAPHSEEDTWTLIEKKVRAGMPFVAALREGGYDPKDIATIMKEHEIERLQAQRFYDRGQLEPGFGVTGEVDDAVSA